MLLDKMVLETEVFELRYEKAYLYLDHCGTFLNDFFEKYPTFSTRRVSPEKVILKDSTEDIRITCNEAILNIQQLYSNSPRQKFEELVSYLVELVTRHLGVHTLTRIGNRVTYFIPRKNMQETIDAISKFRLLNLPEERTRIFGSLLSEAGLAIRIEDNDGWSCKLSIESTERTFTYEVPTFAKVDISAFHPVGITLDIDYYTNKLVDIAIVDPSAIMNRLQRMLHQRLSQFLYWGE
jgi:hypothetical protein